VSSSGQQGKEGREEGEVRGVKGRGLWGGIKDRIWVIHGRDMEREEPYRSKQVLTKRMGKAVLITTRGNEDGWEGRGGMGERWMGGRGGRH
jgi:hypothetical protein